MDYSQGIVRRRRVIPPSQSFFAASAAAFGCAGTPGLHSPSPNDITDGTYWHGTNYSQLANQPDPLGGTTATSITSTVSGGSFDVMFNNVPAFTLNSGTTYTFGAYIKSLAGPTWVCVQTSDSVANAFGSWFNISGSGAVGSTNIAGTGALTCAQVAAAGNGYVQVSIGGNVSVTNALMQFIVFMVDGDGTGLDTLNQSIAVWQVCP